MTCAYCGLPVPAGAEAGCDGLGYPVCADCADGDDGETLTAPEEAPC